MDETTLPDMWCVPAAAFCAARYIEAADRTWGEIKPTLQETRVHAKCLRSLPLVRDYFRNYRAKKKVRGRGAAAAGRCCGKAAVFLNVFGRRSWTVSAHACTLTCAGKLSAGGAGPCTCSSAVATSHCVFCPAGQGQRRLGL